LKNIIPILRNDFKITQQELADEMDVSRQTIISIENEKYNPSIILAHKIAVFFNKTIEEIFDFKENDDEKKHKI
jgi:putative transcriptional regulator